MNLCKQIFDPQSSSAGTIQNQLNNEGKLTVSISLDIIDITLTVYILIYL